MIQLEIVMVGMSIHVILKIQILGNFAIYFISLPYGLNSYTEPFFRFGSTRSVSLAALAQAD
jgi:hypothetical protein